MNAIRTCSLGTVYSGLSIFAPLPDCHIRTTIINMPGVSSSSAKHTVVKGKVITRAPLANTGVKTNFAFAAILLVLALVMSRWVGAASLTRARWFRWILRRSG